MGLFEKLFKPFMGSRYYTAQTARAAPWSKDLYEQETVRAIIDCIASHTAKSEALHVIVDKDGRVKEIKRNSPYTKLLNQSPNALMSGFDLKYKLIAQLEAKNTAFCYVQWERAQPAAMIPINYSTAEVMPITGGGYALRFTDPTDGQTYTVNLEDIVVLRKHYVESEVFGDSNAPVYNTLDMVKASDEGFMEALSVSNKVRGILVQKKAMLAPGDVKKGTEDFTERFKEAAKNGGIVGVDSMEQYTPLNVTAYSANSSQMREIRQNLMRYWRVSEEILTSNFNEGQWQAFYESVIEPLLIQMGQAFTNACFTKTERDHGNRIIFSSSALLNASTQTKVVLIQAVKEIGMFSRNEMREMFGYHPVEGGDEYIYSLNYIKGSDMTEYQTGKKGENPDGQKPDGDQSGSDDQSI